jgi:hypothetical protein
MVLASWRMHNPWQKQQGPDRFERQLPLGSHSAQA